MGIDTKEDSSIEEGNVEPSEWHSITLGVFWVLFLVVWVCFWFCVLN